MKSSRIDLADRAPAVPRVGGAPFVLIEDARPGGQGRLFADPVEIVVARAPGALPAALARLRAALDDGLTAAGYLAYEAAVAFEPRWPAPAAWPEEPLLWFGLFEGERAVPPPPSRAGASVAAVRPLVPPAWHGERVRRVLDYIAAGDIYQANLTFPCAVEWSGDPLALYARVRAASAAGHGGIVDTGDGALLSASPELFFTLAEGRITARPMKGTAPRSAAPAADAANAAALHASAKERAENLMITDLLRNDLSRIAMSGSVRVRDLFAIEAYPTVFQMTSTVEARPRDGIGPIDVLAAAFPCGSVTGAPKLRAAEIIAELEVGPRGPYTGAIGWMRRDAASFGVTIRTLVLAPDGGARVHVGSGIVADSDPAREWDECLAKAAFLR